MIFEKWDKNQLLTCSYCTEEIFLQILIANDKFKDAKEVIKKLEALNLITPNVLRMKADILLGEGYEIDALKILLKIFENFREDQFVIDMIIAISLNHKRQIPKSVLESANNIGTSRLLMLVAKAYERQDRYEDAKITITKALFRADKDELDVYQNYFYLQLKFEKDTERKITCIDADTVVYLESDVEHEQKIICIYKEKVLPNEPYEWENAVHIHMNTALQMSLIRKKTGMKVKISDENYTIKNVLSVDYYLFQICCEKMEISGIIKPFNLDIQDDKVLNYDEFLNWFKNNLAKSDKNKWLEKLHRKYSDKGKRRRC